MSSGDDHRAIEGLINDYAEGFRSLDAALLTRIWDKGYRDIIYTPIEHAEPLRGWPAIAAYYQRLTTLFSRVLLMQIGDLDIDLLGDTAYAFFTFRFVGEMHGEPGPFQTQGRNTVLFRRTGAGWRGIHYHESARPGRH
ncbi:hypothetical protein S7S_01065 [Isoalcanivorax pacificus W11-5]|uniref:SnoaL-like domain-containing protein n=1 Tax=Isoalcanivorax pacificus W11-5 TaxID=391936 RepID=A0A0B4XJN8_9GAMM|nr:nuclear transport factor 2 family protein [Isoalcanivorax pacificus]AJD46637.1 hypothetical protein S7S_01065 [Isoalcanivorax pacificus W11-5]